MGESEKKEKKEKEVKKRAIMVGTLAIGWSSECVASAT